MSRNIIAILRGIQPKEDSTNSATLIDAGISRIEVPLNSTEPLKSTALVAEAFECDALIGGNG